MNKKPFLNGISASAYILLLVTIGNYFGKNIREPSLLIPIVMISTFTLSAAVMGYLFIFEPAQLYLSGKKKEGVNFFLKTVGTFTLITAVIAALMFSGAINL